MMQIELGLEIPSEVEEALREEAKKRELLKTFLTSGALTGIWGTVGRIDIDGSNQLLNGWDCSVSYYRQDKANYYADEEPHNPGIHLSFTRDEEGTPMRNHVSVDYYKTGEVKVRGSQYEFPVMLNRPKRPNTRIESLRERLPGGLRFDSSDWYFGNRHLIANGNLNADLPVAIKAAFVSPARYHRRIF